VQRASQMAHFNHRRIVENLQQVFEEEAQRRNATHNELAEKATD
jgi:hypothetical protein